MTTEAGSNKGIYKAIISVMREMPSIGKDSVNKTQGFKYRGIDAVYNTLKPLLAKHGVFTVPELLEGHRDERANKSGGVLAFVTLKMRYTFFHEDGSSVSCVVQGEGMDSGDKASNKAMAIAHKYAMFQTFCIPTEDVVDPDAECHEVTPKNIPQRTATKLTTAAKMETPKGVEWKATTVNIAGQKMSLIYAAENYPSELEAALDSFREEWTASDAFKTDANKVLGQHMAQAVEHAKNRA